MLRSLRLGARGYVTKAEGLRDLAETLRRVLDGERATRAGLEQDAVLALGRFRAARARAPRSRRISPRERQVLELLADGLTMQRSRRGWGSRRGPSRRTWPRSTGSSARARVQCLRRQRWGSWSCSLGRAPADSEEWRHPAATTKR